MGRKKAVDYTPEMLAIAENIMDGAELVNRAVNKMHSHGHVDRIEMETKLAHREDRRQKVLEMKANGKSNRQIAKELGFGPATIDRDVNAANAAKTASNEAPKKARPKHPATDRLRNWLSMVLGEAAMIHQEFGSLEAMLKKPELWDWKEVASYTLPSLESFLDTIGNFKTAIEKEVHNHVRKPS